jgi:trimethylamine--corrinoid protein Co-methyltransferase
LRILEELGSDLMSARAGAKDATPRASETWKRALAEFTQPPLDIAIREELDAYGAMRRAAIGSDDP